MKRTSDSSNLKRRMMKHDSSKPEAEHIDRDSSKQEADHHAKILLRTA